MAGEEPTTIAEMIPGLSERQVRDTLLSTELKQKYKKKWAEKGLRPGATVAALQRHQKTALAKERFGPGATATDYDRHQKTARAKKFFGPDATRKDYESLLDEERQLAEVEGVSVDVIRARRQPVRGHQ